MCSLGNLFRTQNVTLVHCMAQHCLSEKTAIYTCLDAGGDDDAAGSSGSGGGPSGSTAGGMRLYLSQIREWIVEFSCDMLFISMRTDVAWYRLSQ